MEILNQTPIMTQPELALLAMLLFGFVAFLISGIMMAETYKIELAFKFVIASLITIFVSLLAIPFVKSFCGRETGRYRYEVLLNGDMSCNEVYDKYDVIERRGSIWVLEDKK